jgi:serine/threonine protein kinase
MTKNDPSTSDSATAGEKPLKTVFLSYRFAGQSRFDIVRQLAVRLRFFSIEVVLDQRSLDYGEDIKEFMRQEIHRADAIVLVVTEDYNRALLASSGPGEGVRFEVQVALQEKRSRPSFQVIPLLLDQVRPVSPFDQMKCAVPEEIDEVVTQLGFASNQPRPEAVGLARTSSLESRVLCQRYRIDRLIEMRGVARVFRGWDMVADLPIEVYSSVPEVYSVPGPGQNLKSHFDLFERVVKGRSSAFSPFLLNVRDTYIDSRGGYYLITERFDGTDLGVPLAHGETTHPFGALCLAFQVLLALHELHSVGVVHGGLAPRCIRLNVAQTSCKIVDFEFATPLEFTSRTAGALEGYPHIMPPERFAGSQVTIQQDIYQVGNLVLRLVCGKHTVSRSAPPFFRQDATALVLEDPIFRKTLLEELANAVEKHRITFSSGHAWLAERVRETSSVRFLRKKLTPLLAWCLAPRPEDRPRNCLELAVALKDIGVPAVGHLLDPEGIPVSKSLFPLRGPP